MRAGAEWILGSDDGRTGRGNRSDLPRLLWILLLLVELTMLWSSSFVPSNDGPSHLYSAWILQQLDRQPAGEIATYFRRNPESIFPDAGYAWFLDAAGRVLSLRRAEKLGLSLYLVALPLSVGWLARALGRDGELSALVAVGLSFDFLFFMGFFNFLFGLPLSFAFLAVERRLLVAPSWWRVALANLLLAATYCAHLVAFACAVLGVGVLILLTRSSRRWMAIAGCLPVVVLSPLFWPASVAVGDNWFWKGSLVERVQALAGLRVATAFGGRELEMAWIAAALVAGAALWSLARAWPRGGLAVSGLAAVFLLGALALPSRIGKGSFLVERLGLYFWLAMACAIAFPRGPSRRWMAIALATMVALHLVAVDRSWRSFDRDMRVYLAGLPSLPSGARVFCMTDFGPEEPYLARPMGSVADYYYMALGSPDFDHYQASPANESAFPVAYTPAGLARYQGDAPLRRQMMARIAVWADYLVVWGDPASMTKVTAHWGYRPIFREGRLRVLARGHLEDSGKRAPRASRSKSRRSISLEENRVLGAWTRS